MSNIRRRFKKRLLVQHRKEQYLHAIQKVIDGKAEPDYATERWNKLKKAQGR